MSNDPRKSDEPKKPQPEKSSSLDNDMNDFFEEISDGQDNDNLQSEEDQVSLLNQLNMALNEEVTSLRSQLDQQAEDLEKERTKTSEALKGQERLKREFDEKSKSAIANFAKDVLHVMDNLERSLEHMTEDERKNDPKLDAIAKGVELTQRQLTKTFNKYGIHKIDSLGQPFDPDLHEAMTTEDAKDGVEPDTVIEELESGYTLNGKLLRPARVKVSK